MKKAKDVDEYLLDFPPETKNLLKQMRATIKKAAPKAEEVISYGMPAYRLDGVLVYFAGYGKHIGFYPTGRGVAAFQQELTKYKTSKGAIQFPLDKPLPLALITKIVRFRVKDNLDRPGPKKKKSAKKKTA